MPWENDSTRKLREMTVSGKEANAGNQGNTNQIIYPWLKPWVRIVDIIKQNAKAFDFTDKVEEKPWKNSVSPSQSMFDFLKPAKKMELNTRLEPALQRLFDPFVESFHEFGRLTKDLQPLDPITTSSIIVQPKSDMFENNLLFPKSATPQNTVYINSLVKNAPLTQQTEVTNHLFKKSKM
ncbi:unnamed protein product [Onchocerca flexuosa]|uniref:Uncharacterized protein n=1 Tax=Onchocerca flexuosa TaxID=387005 RepID=A0A183H9Q3_9BILA|nr:unnamed protein product [Onchocerca flexuosa]